MTTESETIVDHYHLVDLVVDGKLVEFTSATITQETVWVGSGERQRTVRRWYGQIVSNGFGIDVARLHTLVGRTNDLILRGFFRTGRVLPECLDMTGSGALICTSSKHGGPGQGTLSSSSRAEGSV